MVKRRGATARLAVAAVVAAAVLGGQGVAPAVGSSGSVASTPDVLPALPTVRVTDHFGEAAALLGALGMDPRGEQFRQSWEEAREAISHDGVRGDSFAAGTRLVVTTGALVRHLQGNASGVPAEQRGAVTAKLRAGAELLVATALVDLRLALSEPIGVPAPRAERAGQLLSQATKAHEQAQSVRGNDQSALAHLTTGWRKLMDGFAGLGIELSGDSDADGLVDHVEFIVGSNVFSADTDRDGLGDLFEVEELFGFTSSVMADSDADGTGDADEDFDSDGLTHLEEQRFGSSPLDADGDGDGLDDADEQRLGTDPRTADSDGDTLVDGVEPRQGLSPVRADTDGDGIRDDAETVSATLEGPAGVSATVTGTGDLVDDARIVEVPPTAATAGIPGQAGPAYDFQLTEQAAAGMTGGVITLPYDPAQVASDDARVFYLDQDESLWRPAAEAQTVDPAAGTVSVAVEHFSTYAVFDTAAWERRWAEPDSCLARGTSKLDIALILDSSGSMAKNDPDDRRLDAARGVVDSLVPGDRAAVVEFDADGTLLAELTGDRVALRRAIRTVDAEGSPTRIGAGVRVALDELGARGRTGAVRGAILIADGAGSYNVDFTREARDAGIVVHTVGLGNDSDFAVLRDIADGTGGTFARVKRAENLPEVYRRLADSTGGANLVDSDADGLTDCRETSGILASDGRVYRTDPHSADTDGDDLSDGEEVGQLVDFARLGAQTGIRALRRLGEAGARVHALRADPVLADSDFDGIIDPVERDDETLVFDKDSENDGLGDGAEREIGTNPWLANSDGDEFSDEYEFWHLSDGLNPLYYNQKVSKWTYVGHFLLGFAAGDLVESKASLAWLTGYLCSTAIPLVDLRDLLGNALRGEWIGAGLSALGLIPIGGDVTAAVGKIAKFVAKHLSMQRDVAVYLAKSGAPGALRVDALRTTSAVPRGVQVKALQTVFKKSWDDLITAGADEAGLIRMAGGGTDLDALLAATRRAGHVESVVSPIHASWRAGETFLEDLFEVTTKGIDKQVWRSTRNLRVNDGPISQTLSIGVGRYIDVLPGNVAREAKTGWVRYTPSLATQISKDGLLVRATNVDVNGAHWHFMPSGRSNTVGADPRILDLLDYNKIPYTIHLPTS
ncbi:VWA domain-containing protein [Nocardioides sp.]|uniref:VWA domain-containing protein n=1 Tax=Nocardioides sp. TaxID=35761 RepID=UPI002D7ECF23|nr:VWA domain-containing protein [Nocardioides sp.]